MPAEGKKVIVYAEHFDTKYSLPNTGDQSFSRFSTGSPYRQVLLDVLLRHYPRDHDVIVYEATTLPTRAPKIVRLKLHTLPALDISMHATLVIPPSKMLEPDTAIRERLAALDSKTKETA